MRLVSESCRYSASHPRIIAASKSAQSLEVASFSFVGLACISFFGNVITNLQAVLRDPQDIDPAGFALLGVSQIARVRRWIIENPSQVF